MVVSVVVVMVTSVEWAKRQELMLDLMVPHDHCCLWETVSAQGLYLLSALVLSVLWGLSVLTEKKALTVLKVPTVAKGMYSMEEVLVTTAQMVVTVRYSMVAVSVTVYQMVQCYHHPPSHLVDIHTVHIQHLVACVSGVVVFYVCSRIRTHHHDQMHSLYFWTPSIPTWTTRTMMMIPIGKIQTWTLYRGYLSLYHLRAIYQE
jgi:hypothetical protein